MKAYSHTRLSDQVLLSTLDAAVVHDRNTTAEMLSLIAEVDERRLYLPAAHGSMFEYCVGKLHMSDGAAYRRIHAARAARSFPAIFEAVADGRVHLTAVVTLAPHLTRANAGELLAAAAHKTRAQIELLVAERFPRPDLPARVRPILTSPGASAVAMPPALAPDSRAQLVANTVSELAPARVDETESRESPPPGAAPSAPARVAALSPQRFGVQFTMSQEAHDLLRYAQALLGHAVPSGDISKVIELALAELVRKLERDKFAVTSRASQNPRRGKPTGRTIPAAVRREVLLRDKARCTFVSPDGRRCESRTRLEFDHVQPYARGGEPSVGNLRLRCRAHNQFGAESVYGKRFMDRKRRASGAAAPQPDAA